MVSKLYSNDPSRFVMPELLTIDTFYCPSSTFGGTEVTIHVFSGGGGGHFEFCPLAQLAVSFERYIGANFSFKWFRLTNQSRKKGLERLVMEPLKMTPL